MQNKEKLIKYAAIKQQMSHLEDELDKLKPEVEAIVLEANPVDGIVEVDEVGTFTLIKRRKYTYSENVTSMENALKEAKQAEEARGTAPYEEMCFVKFNSVNIE